MARDIVVRGVTFPGRIAWEGRFARLLIAANSRITTPETDAALEAVANQRAPELAPDSTMPAWMWITLRNLYAYVRAGAVYRRRCPECERWFQAFKKTQHTCRRSVCRTAYGKADARQRAKRSRQHPIHQKGKLSRRASRKTVQIRTK